MSNLFEIKSGEPFAGAPGVVTAEFSSPDMDKRNLYPAYYAKTLGYVSVTKTLSDVFKSIAVTRNRITGGVSAKIKCDNEEATVSEEAKLKPILAIADTSLKQLGLESIAQTINGSQMSAKVKFITENGLALDPFCAHPVVRQAFSKEQKVR